MQPIAEPTTPPVLASPSLLLCSAKEAFFKSQFALTAAVPDFTDVAFRVADPLDRPFVLVGAAIQHAKPAPGTMPAA